MFGTIFRFKLMSVIKVNRTKFVEAILPKQFVEALFVASVSTKKPNVPKKNLTRKAI